MLTTSGTRLASGRHSFTVLVRLLAIAGLILISASSLRAASLNAQVFSVSGTVEAADPGSSKFRPIKKGDILPIGSTVRTGDDGVAVIATTPLSAVQVGNSSNMKINDLAFAKSGSTLTQNKAVIQLNAGVVSALIDPKTPKVTDFRIQTPQGAAAARGTFYAVLVFEGKTYIGVKEGKVAATSK